MGITPNRASKEVIGPTPQLVPVVAGVPPPPPDANRNNKRLGTRKGGDRTTGWAWGVASAAPPVRSPAWSPSILRKHAPHLADQARRHATENSAPVMRLEVLQLLAEAEVP